MGCMKSSIREDKTIKSPEDIVIHPGMFVRMNPIRKRFFDEYLMVRCLGEGSFAQVHLCTHKSLGVKRAVKIYSKELVLSNEAKSQFKNELILLRTLDHPNIIKVFEAFEDAENYYLVMEHCPGGELIKKIIQSYRFSEREVAKIMKQLFSCIAYLHSQHIAHRDIKPENIMFDEDKETIKIIDFGHSAKFREASHMTSTVGSPFYVAPEVCSGKYTEKCDLWSSGVILYILLRRRPPFSGKKSGELVKNIKKCTFDLSDARWQKISDGAKSLVKKLLVREDKRICAWEAMEDSWIIGKGSFSEPNSATFRHAMDNMASVKTSNKLVDAVQMFVATQLITSKESSDAKAVFRSLDRDSDGKITRDDFERLFHKFRNNPETAREEVDRIMHTIDTSRSGFFGYTDFLRAAVDSVHRISNERLETAFLYFDRDKDGKISRTELKKALSGQIQSEPAVWEDIIKGFDLQSDTIELQEFKNLFYRQLK